MYGLDLLVWKEYDATSAPPCTDTAHCDLSVASASDPLWGDGAGAAEVDISLDDGQTASELPWSLSLSS